MEQRGGGRKRFRPMQSNCMPMRGVGLRSLDPGTERTMWGGEKNGKQAGLPMVEQIADEDAKASNPNTQNTNTKKSNARARKGNRPKASKARKTKITKITTTI